MYIGSVFRAWREVVCKLVEYEVKNPDLLHEEIDWYVDRMKNAFKILSPDDSLAAEFEYIREQLHKLNRKEASD